jgi:inosine-uridine nucleoside N-ribohydrolase
MFEAIQQQYNKHPEQGPVQLIATGALSNVAILLLIYPEVKPLIEITIMGGAMGVGSRLQCWSCMPVHQQLLGNA